MTALDFSLDFCCGSTIKGVVERGEEARAELADLRADNARLRELLSEACNAWEAWVTAYACERKREEIDVRIAQIRKEAGMSEGVSTK